MAMKLAIFAVLLIMSGTMSAQTLPKYEIREVSARTGVFGQVTFIEYVALVVDRAANTLWRCVIRVNNGTSASTSGNTCSLVTYITTPQNGVKQLPALRDFAVAEKFPPSVVPATNMPGANNYLWFVNVNSGDVALCIDSWQGCYFPSHPSP